MFYAVDPVIAIRPAPWYNGTHECKGGAQMAIAYLKSGKEARVLQGNPWVFRSDIDRVSGAWEPGDVYRSKVRAAACWAAPSIIRSRRFRCVL